MKTASSEHETLAIAFLTGQANSTESARFAKLVANDADFRSLVRELEIWLAPLNAPEASIEPPEGLLGKILENLPPQEAARPAPARRPARPAARVHWLWRPAALAATAAAGFVTALPFLMPPDPGTDAPSTVFAADDAGPGFVAALADQSDAKIIVIVYDPREERILARYSNVAPPEDGVWQLWLIRDGAPGPQSIGLFSPAAGTEGQAELSFSEPLLPAGDLLAISLEPPGGSPEAGPTGPVLFTGKVSGLS